ncbi:MAG: SDR family NAD(P)-dependent oxidoreductase [bacterium]|nr:SDR family NAD(P)-dependent oxidoreductase [bacterium]
MSAADSHRFQGKVVIVTGASKGVGLMAARGFAAEGAHVVLSARSPGPLKAARQSLPRPEDALVVKADMANLKDAERLIKETIKKFGRIDVLVNNAGYNARGDLEEVALKDVLHILDVNLRAPIAMAKLALPHLQKTGGAIVNVASIAGCVPVPEEATYSATKAALRWFSMALHEEVAAEGVRVSVVSPGPIDTDFIMNSIDEVPDLVFSQPMCTPEEVAALIVERSVDGARESKIRASSGFLATFAYIFPGVRRALLPTLRKKGARIKARLKKERGLSA